MDDEFAATLKTPFGALGVCCDGAQIAQIRFLPPGTRRVCVRARRLRGFLQAP